MKVGIVGAGAVGTASLFALVAGNVADEVVVIDRTESRAAGVVTDLQYGAVLGETRLTAGGYEELAGASIVAICAGINERAGGATDRSDPSGRLRLLKTNAEIYRDIVPKIVAAAPDAVILVVTDPPDPLAQLARDLAGNAKVVSTGTYLDSLRFRFHLARQFDIAPRAVQAMVLGEHGTSAVPLWSSVRIGGVPIKQFIQKLGRDEEEWRAAIEKEVRFANITIIEGTGASQLGIGVVVARICKAILHDERTVLPVAAYSEIYGTTLSLPSILGRHGIEAQYVPDMTEAEAAALQRSAEVIKDAVAGIQ
jgi:L-lactate dehydrogenase